MCDLCDPWHHHQCVAVMGSLLLLLWSIAHASLGHITQPARPLPPSHTPRALPQSHIAHLRAHVHRALHARARGRAHQHLRLQ